MNRETGRGFGPDAKRSKPNYYEILGIAAGATSEEIKMAFRLKAKETHPDKPMNQGKEDLFKQVNEAYQTLRDPEQRNIYDMSQGLYQTGSYSKSAGSHKRSPMEYEKGFNFTSDDFLKEREQIVEREGLLIIQSGDMFFRQEFLADPVTKKKLGYTGYANIFKRDGLIIALAQGAGFVHQEYLLDEKTGRNVNSSPFDRIERRGNQIIGIKNSSFFSTGEEKVIKTL